MVYRVFIISDTRTGSTAVSQAISSSLSIPNLSEIFIKGSSEHWSYDSFNRGVGEYFQFLEGSFELGYVAKIMYHDLFYGLKIPSRLTLRLPILAEVARSASHVIHLTRQGVVEAALSEIVSADTKIFHIDREEQRSSNKVYVDPQDLAQRVLSRLVSEKIAAGYIKNSIGSNIFHLLYERCFSPEGGNLKKRLTRFLAARVRWGRRSSKLILTSGRASAT